MSDEQLLAVPKVAAELGVTAQTIRNWIDHGVLPAARFGHVYRVRREDVEALRERASADSSSLATRRDVWTPATSSLPRRRGASRAPSISDATSDSPMLVRRS